MYKKIFHLLILSVLIFSSCSRNTVDLDYTNATGEVPQLGNLVFRFSKPMVSDSLLNFWDSTEYVRFEPAIPGKFRWESPDQLIFSPSEPLLPATDYKADIRKEVLRYTEFDKVNHEDLRFYTPALELVDANISWVLQTAGDSRSAAPRLDLAFNYSVDPAELKKLLNIDVEGKTAAFSLQTVSASDQLSLLLRDLKTGDEDLAAEIGIAKGLKPERGSNQTKEKIERKFIIPSPYVLRVQQVQSEHDGLVGLIRVRTSQQIADGDLKNFLSVEPAISFTTERTDAGFLLRSEEFNVEKAYTLTIKKGLRGIIGGTLREDQPESVAFGELESDISFTNSKSVYLAKGGAQNIEVRITSVPKVKLVISKIYQSNLVLAQRYGYYPQETNDSEDYYDYGGSAQLGDVIYEKEIDTRSLAKYGESRLLDLRQIEDRLQEFKGIYHVMIRSTEDYWVRDSRFISLSDIGLIAREGHDRIVVFANSIREAKSMNNVEILVYGNNNQLLGSAFTNAEGVAEVNYTKKQPAGFRPAMIIAKTADDFNYLPFQRTRVNMSRFEVGGKRLNSTGIDAYIYAERDIYRPGERVNFSVILRDRYWQLPGDVPVKMKFLLPNGRELKSFRKNLNEQGSVEGYVDVSDAAITGSYLLEIYSANDVLLASKPFMIEEFMPDRIKVNASLHKKAYRPGENVALNLNAKNFFGPPAANRNYEVELQVRQVVFQPKDFKEYDFALANQSGFSDKIILEGKTDAEGNAQQQFELKKKEYDFRGLLQLRAFATVFDETGRPVSRSAMADLHTQDVYLGIQRSWSRYFPLNQPVSFKLAAVTPQGRSTNTKAVVKMVKTEYRTQLVRSGSYFRYESRREDKVLAETEITVGNGTVWSYTPRTAGDYELRVSLPGAETYISSEFYSYGYWGSSASSFEVNREGNIDIEADKKSYQPGEKAKLLFKTPFSGRLLITVETDKVISHRYLNVDKRDASMELELSTDHLPNVYVTATLIKPHGISDIPLTVAHGYLSLQVEEPKRKIPVTITATERSRSRTKQKITVQAEPGSFITLAAVDNGVLQVSGFETPDPYAHFYQRRALQVNSYDLYPLLFPEIRPSSTGGDGELSMEKRVNPMPAKRVKILSYWSGIKKVGANGRAQFEIDIPQFSGQVRLMAVAYHDKSFGSAESSITIADPIVLSTALPRFLSPGDSIDVPVTISNTTAKPVTVDASLTLSGPFQTSEKKNVSLSIPANSEGQAKFTLVAKQEIGVGKVRVEVNGLGEKFIEETEMSVRPPSTLQKIAGNGTISSGSSAAVNIPTRDFIPGSIAYKLVISRSPMAELGKHLQWLVQYPYGCTEQVVSSAFPQLYFGDLAAHMEGAGAATFNANANVLEAIRKIKMRQLYNGALTLWDGEGTEHWWTTVYAAHFLIEARKAGFSVDDNLLNPMLSFIASKMRNRELITYYYNRNQNRKIAPKEVAYALYVLSLAGRPDVSSMNYYKARPDILALDSRYLLSAAFAISGDRRAFADMLPGSFSGEESVPQTGGSFYSPLRDEAIALTALLEVDPGNAQVPVMVRHVSNMLKADRWYNTQERSFSFLALGRFARMNKASTATADVVVNGRKIATVGETTWKANESVLKSTNINLQVRGQGNIYYFWEAEGISASGDYEEKDSYIKVRRKFYDRHGRVISGNSFTQNDLVIIGITLENAYNTDIENIVITDLLPAGFEIENPRTKEIPGMDWIKDASTPTALDVRDDRIHFFVDLTRNKQVYYYAVRAVSPGVFRMGPVSADAMYQAEYHSYHGGGVVIVRD